MYSRRYSYFNLVDRVNKAAHFPVEPAQQEGERPALAAAGVPAIRLAHQVREFGHEDQRQGQEDSGGLLLTAQADQVRFR